MQLFNLAKEAPVFVCEFCDILVLGFVEFFQSFDLELEAIDLALESASHLTGFDFYRSLALAGVPVKQFSDLSLLG